MAYIDADKFAEEICNFPAIDEDSANAVISLLHRQPTADVEEVKHGEWKSEWSVLANALYFNCSLCGESDPWQGRGRGRAKYCPKCGAKMDSQF